jgi:3-oxoacyl-(acyl-carrier-protein) synthase
MPVAANRSLMGHTVGAAGAIEAAFRELSLAVLSNSFGFGGANASLVFRRLEGPGGR